MSEHDPLTAAIIRAGERLYSEYTRNVTDGGEGGPPEPDGQFVTVIRQELLPLINVDAYRASRIAALRAELAALEGEA